jgi:Uma2 family endonuclease
MLMALAVRRFTVDEYLRMGAAGVFKEDDRVELIEGQIVEMTPIGPAHAGCVKEMARLLYRAAGDRIIVGVQDPLVLGKQGAPQPDIAVLRRTAGGYRTDHPGAADTFLVIEVADTSADYDRETKMPLYARANIPEAWLVSLEDRAVEISTDPGPGGYRSLRRARAGEILRPRMLPGVEIAVSDILG